MSDWIPEQLQDAPFFKTPESGEPRTPEQVVADLQNAAKLQGNLSQSHIKLPAEGERLSEDAIERLTPYLPPSEPAAPAAPEEYTLPDGQEVNPALVEQAKSLALTQDQFDTLLTSQPDIEGFKQEQHDQLRAEWGLDLNFKLQAVEAFLSQPGTPPNLVNAYTAGTMDAESIAWLSDLAGQMDEEPQIRGQEGGDPNPRERVDSLRKELMGMRPGNPQYESKLAELTKTLSRAGTLRRTG